MASIHFTLGFQEEYFTIDGASALHILITSDEAATASILYSFDVTLQSTNKAYTQNFNVSMPQGQSRVSVPFVVPMEWSNDFAQNIGDTAHGDACGVFWATMTAHYTMYAGTQQFTNDYRGYQANLSGTVKSSVLPTAGSLSAVATDGKVPPEWGLWVQGVSRARITAIGASGAWGSSIVAYTFANSGAQTENSAELLLDTPGTITVPVTVEDSRGRLSTSDLVLTVQPYTPPALSGLASHRCSDDGTLAEEGSCFSAACRLAASPLDGKNPVNVKCAWKKVTESSYGAPVALTPGTAQIVAANLEKGASYDVKYTVTDAFYAIDYYDYVSSTVYLMHFLKGGTGIAVGKAAEQQNLFDVALDTKLRRDVTVGGKLDVTGTLSLGGTDVGAALKESGSYATAHCSLHPDYLPQASENNVFKCGHVVICRLHGTMQNQSADTPTYEGASYPVAALPAGFYSTVGAMVAFASQNTKPCRAVVGTDGWIFVTPVQDGYEDTEVFCVGIV